MEELDKIHSEPNDSGSEETAKQERADLLDRRWKHRKRKDAEQIALHKLFLVALWVFAILTLCCVIILTIHFAAPPCWRWLPEADLEKLRTNLGSVLIGAILSKYLEGKFKQQDEEPK